MEIHKLILPKEQKQKYFKGKSIIRLKNFPQEIIFFTYIGNFLFKQTVDRNSRYFIFQEKHQKPELFDYISTFNTDFLILLLSPLKFLWGNKLLLNEIISTLILNSTKKNVEICGRLLINVQSVEWPESFSSFLVNSFNNYSSFALSGLFGTPKSKLPRIVPSESVPPVKNKHFL